MREKTENLDFKTLANRYFFVRTDDKEEIFSDQFDDYRVTPAEHMNLSPQNSNQFLNSGYLSTFMFTNGWGLQQALALNKKYIHFICIDPRVCEEIYLTGGTQGLTNDSTTKDKLAKDNTQITVNRLDGTSWNKPVFNRFIPQIFFTNIMQVELGATGTRNLSEVLLGGNWQDFAEIFSLSRREASEIQGENNKDAFYRTLQSRTTPYRLVQGVFWHLSKEEKLENGQRLKTMLTWWNQLNNKELMCFTYGMFYQGYPLAAQEVSPINIGHMHRLAQKLDSTFTNTPASRHFYDSAIDISRQLVQASAFISIYKQISDHFINHIKGFLSLDEASRRLYLPEGDKLLSNFQKKLDVETNFWRLYREMVSLRLEKAEHYLREGQEKIIQGWNTPVNAASQKNIIRCLRQHNADMNNYITEQRYQKALSSTSIPTSASSSSSTSIKNLINEWFKEYKTILGENGTKNSDPTFFNKPLGNLSNKIAGFNTQYNNFSKKSNLSANTLRAYAEIEQKVIGVVNEAMTYQRNSSEDTATILIKTSKFIENSLTICIGCMASLNNNGLLNHQQLTKLRQIEENCLTKSMTTPTPMSLQG